MLMTSTFAHRRARAMFVDALDATLAPEARAGLHQHLEACEACRASFDRYARTVGRLSSLGSVKAPPGLARALRLRARRRRGSALSRIQAQLVARSPVEVVLPVLLAALTALVIILLST